MRLAFGVPAAPFPRTASSTILSSGAAVASKDLELKDVKDPQSFDVFAKAATTFRLTVKSVYASSGGTNVAITEVEFRAAK